MTYKEFDSLYLWVRSYESEPSSGFRSVLVSPATYTELCEEWSWVGHPPREFVCSTLVGDEQIGVER